MRIIAGEFRSRRLHTPPDASTTRPIPDRVKESLFELLRGHFQGAAVFDGFAGTGAIGLEALSRGAARCVFVEQNRAVAAILERNIAELGVADRCEVLRADALGPGALARCPRPVNLAFLDPPYALVRSDLGWERVRTQMSNLVGRLSDDGFAILRTPWPFLQGDHPPPAPSAGEVAEPRRGRREPRTRRTYPQDQRRAPNASDLPPDPPPHKPDLPPVDLTLPNADGPETHTYQTTAVHLYARPPRRADAGPD